MLVSTWSTWINDVSIAFDVFGYFMYLVSLYYLQLILMAAFV